LYLKHCNSAPEGEGNIRALVSFTIFMLLALKIIFGYLQNKGLHLNTYGFNLLALGRHNLNLKITLTNMFGDNTLNSSKIKRPSPYPRWRKNICVGKKHGFVKIKYLSVYAQRYVLLKKGRNEDLKI
jgi:hypothetical protein